MRLSDKAVQAFEETALFGVSKRMVTLHIKNKAPKQIASYKALRRTWKHDMYKHGGLRHRPSEIDATALQTGKLESDGEADVVLLSQGG